MRTPWGIADKITKYNDFVSFVSTPSHGGFKVAREALKLMPVAYRNADGWYEEDCEFCKVVLAFPDLFNSEQQTSAKACFEFWFNSDGTYKQR